MLNEGEWYWGMVGGLGLVERQWLKISREQASPWGCAGDEHWRGHRGAVKVNRPTPWPVINLNTNGRYPGETATSGAQSQAREWG